MLPVEIKSPTTNKSTVNPLKNHWLLLLSLFILSISSHSLADPGFVSRIQIRTNNEAVTATVDKPNAPVGETVTLTISDIPAGYKATPTAESSSGGSEVTLTPGTPPSGNSTYTFTMPADPVYIDIKIEPDDTFSSEYTLTVETPGITAGKVNYTVTVGSISLTDDKVTAGQAVVVKLNLPAGGNFEHTATEVLAPDGSWLWADLSGSKNPATVSFNMPETNVVVRFHIEEKETPPTPPTPPGPDDPDTPGEEETTYYTVTLPAVEGATTNPAAGDYRVESYGTFTFYLLLDKAYDQSQPVVTTGDGTPLTPSTGNGAYILKYIRSNQTIAIDGIRRNEATANEPVTLPGLQLRTSAGTAYIVSDRAAEATVYTFGGGIVRHLRLTAGSEQSFTLPRGSYILHAAGQSIKFTL